MDLQMGWSHRQCAILMAPSYKCSYPNCLGIFPDSNLEYYATEVCNKELQHACQAGYEHDIGVQLALHKICITCLTSKVDRLFIIVTPLPSNVSPPLASNEIRTRTKIATSSAATYNRFLGLVEV